MLTNTCIRHVRAIAATEMALQSTSFSTPQTELELAATLRDPNGNRRCPFGTNFEETVVRELAWIEGTGFRIGSTHELGNNAQIALTQLIFRGGWDFRNECTGFEYLLQLTNLLN